MAQVQRAHVRLVIYSRLLILHREIHTPHANARKAMSIGQMANAIAHIHAVHVRPMNF